MLDKPLSKNFELGLSYAGLGIAAWLLGSHVGMTAFTSLAFAVIVAGSVAGIVDFIVHALSPLGKR